MKKKSRKFSTKTNAARLLDNLGIPYELAPFDHSDEHMSAAEVAQMVGQPLEKVFKTLVARGDRTGPLFLVVPSDAEIDLKAAARASQNRTVALVPLNEVTTLTGYVRGGTTALAAKKSFPVFLDDSVRRHAEMMVSAGMRGLQLKLAPQDYVQATRATLAHIGVQHIEHIK